MRLRWKTSSVAVCAAAALCLTTVVAVSGASVAGAATKQSGRVILAGTAASAAVRQHPEGAVAKSSRVGFDLVMQLRDASGAAALVKAVSTPGSASYRHYLTASQWEARFSPTAKQVSSARAWLKSEGFAVGATSKDRITISASGSAAQVEKAFSTTLGYYKVNGQKLMQTSTALSVPSVLAHSVVGALGLNQSIATPAVASEMAAATNTAKKSVNFPPAPGAFITSAPCSSYYGQKSESESFGHGYPSSVPIEVCGYKPAQYRSAYGITSSETGAGQTIAVVDAYGSSTIDADATQYFAANDPTDPFPQANFSQIDMAPFNDKAECGASGWSTEQAIDIESSHSIATNANILYVGAQNCLDSGLLAAEQDVVDNGLANVITNSWSDTGGDLFTDAATKTAYDDVFMMADTSGITVQFSTGDDGDNFSVLGMSTADYPSESPYVTGVGGTSLEIGSNGQQIGDLGWATGRSFECTANIVGDLPGCTSSTIGTFAPASYDGGSGGFTSFNYTQPWYQASAVPADLALRNENVTGATPMRVIPDISMDADASTGFLIGLTEQFPDGTVKYGQTRYGGTSLASPLLAGVIADVDQSSVAAGGVDVGFINPAIYQLNNTAGAIQDIVPAGDQGEFRFDHAFTYLSGVKGKIAQFRELTYTGKLTYCDATGNCVSRKNTLTVTPGYDSMTGLGSIGPSFVSDLAAT